MKYSGLLMGCQMIRRTSDNEWVATCDTCNKEIFSGMTSLGATIGFLHENKWTVENNNYCYCPSHVKEKEKPVCVARDGEFRDEHVFCSTIARCPRVKNDDICPAREHVLWKWQYRLCGTIGYDVYKIYRTPEFLAACAKCLGEGEEKGEEKGSPPLHIGRADVESVEICVQRANEKKCHPSCQFYSPRQYAPSWCNRHDGLCLAGYRCEDCLKEFPLGKVVDAEITLKDRVTELEKRWEGSLGAYQEMFDKVKKLETTTTNLKKEVESLCTRMGCFHRLQSDISSHSIVIKYLQEEIKKINANWKKLSESSMFLAASDRLPKEEKHD